MSGIKGKSGVYLHKQKNRYWLNKKFTEEHRRKIGESQKIAMIGNKNGKGRKGKHQSEETRKKISEAKKGKRMGEKSHFWRGGRMKQYPESERIRKSIEYRLWRKSIYERDNFICQKCGQIGGILTAHHINNFADFTELRLAIDNGITLCKKCHNKFHKKYSRKNNTENQLREFLEK